MEDENNQATIYSNGNAEAPVNTGHRPRKTAVTVISFVAAVGLVVVGVFLQVSFKARDAEGKTTEDLSAEIELIKTELDELTKKEQETFYDNGFGAEYFEAANESAELMAKIDTIEEKISDLNEVEANKNLVSTGALWFFIGALVLIIIGIMVIIR